jgi:SAM-dependent methyltransferase
LTDTNPWDLGDYPAVARRLEPAAAQIATAAGSGRGRFAVDVAAGVGSVALQLADRGWRTAATDSSIRMVELGRRETAAAGQDTEWHVADLADQPFDDASQDLVASSFGLIFSADPGAAVDEIARILTPAGRLIMTAWTDDGYMAQMTETMADFLPTWPGGPQPLQWGSAEFVRDTLAPRFLDVEVERRTLPWSFPSAAACRQWLEQHSPAHVAAIAAAGEGATTMMDAVEQHAARFVDGSGRVSVEAEYLLVTAQRRP